MEVNYKIKHLIKTRTFKIFLISFIIYWMGFIFFILTIYPDTTKLPGQNLLRDIIWIIYWRWNLDYLIIAAFTLIVGLETYMFSKLRKKFSDDTLSIYVSPMMNMAFAFMYMVAIDLGVTYFADTGFDANWTSTDIIWMGFTAQQLYHNFFFWFVPAVIICGIVNQVYLRTNSYSKTFRAFCVLMAIYSLSLGFLDPVVCQILWNDWSIFGTWSMGGADAIFAVGWIAHYIIFAVGWFVMDYLIKSSKTEIDYRVDLKLTR